MKKNIFIIFILLSSILLLTSCGESTTETESPIDENLTVYGGSVGGIWSVFTEGVSEAVRREYPGTLINAVPGTVAGNPVTVSEGKTDFAISESLTALFAYEGKKPFTEKHENLRAVAAIMPENIFQLVAPTSAPFDSIEQIAKEEIAIHYSAGEKDALGDLVSASVFSAYGVSYEDLEAYGGEVNFLSGGKTFDLMADGRIDSLGKMVPIPAGDILEASATIDLKFIPIGERAIDHLVETYGMTPYTMDAGSYEFQTEDYKTVNSPTILITRESMDEDVVYYVTKAIYEQLDYLHDVHNGFEKVNDETIVEVGAIPFHPGAERFFEEKDLLP